MSAFEHPEFPTEHHAYVAFRAEQAEPERFGRHIYSSPVGDRHEGSEEAMREYVAHFADNERVDDVVLIARYELAEVKEVRIRALPVDKPR